MVDPPPSRSEQRKLQTRSALIEAAQRIIAQQGTREVSIQQITDEANVGFGSFYNHFPDKANLFHVAVVEMMEAHAQLLDELMSDEDDAAVRFSIGTRLTCRLPRTDPTLARVIIGSPVSVASADHGHPARMRRDLQRAVDQGRFVMENVPLAAVLTASCVVGALRLCLAQESVPVEMVADQTTLTLLRMFRVEEAEAQRLVTLKLPV